MALDGPPKLPCGFWPSLSTWLRKEVPKFAVAACSWRPGCIGCLGCLGSGGSAKAFKMHGSWVMNPGMLGNSLNQSLAKDGASILFRV